MKRREFLKALTALPIVGPAIAKAAAKPKPKTYQWLHISDYSKVPFRPNPAQEPILEKMIAGEYAHPGQVIRWRRYETPKCYTPPLTEGEVPNHAKLRTQYLCEQHSKRIDKLVLEAISGK